MPWPKEHMDAPWCFSKVTCGLLVQQSMNILVILASSSSFLSFRFPYSLAVSSLLEVCKNVCRITTPTGHLLHNNTAFWLRNVFLH